MNISIIVPTKNEENNIGPLLDILLQQEKPFEIIIADADSTDKTHNIIKEYKRKHPEIKLCIKKGRRGETMNSAINMAQGNAVSFIGADDRADKNWIKYIRIALYEGHKIVVGTCETKGKKEFSLGRVKLFYEGFDISVPGTNTTYKKEVLNKIDGFDPSFLTAEDIDMNLRAVKAGYSIFYEEKAIVYRYTREDILSFLKQSYENGYGRKQLTQKHGSLWKQYSPKQTLSQSLSLFGILRIFFGFIGYVNCKIFNIK